MIGCNFHPYAQKIHRKNNDFVRWLKYTKMISYDEYQNLVENDVKETIEHVVQYQFKSFKMAKGVTAPVVWPQKANQWFRNQTLLCPSRTEKGDSVDKNHIMCRLALLSILCLFR